MKIITRDYFLVLDSKGFGWIEPYLQREDDMDLKVLRT